MEEKKNNKGLIWLIVILIILVLGLIGYIVYDKVLLEDKEPINNENTTTNIKENDAMQNAEESINKEDYNDIKTFEITLNDNSCVSLTEKQYYDYSPYKVNVKIMNTDNKIMKYEYISSQEFEIEYYNSKKIKEKENYEPLLSYICNYSNYFITTEGWEGTPYNKIIDEEGNIVHEFNGNFEYDNEFLEITSFVYISSNETEIEKYKLDLKSPSIEKKDMVTKKFDCSKIINSNENESEIDKEIQSYCAYYGNN